MRIARSESCLNVPCAVRPWKPPSRLAAGKAKRLAIGACVRKHPHLCFGVVKTRGPYSLDYALPA
jgi:hypothetical protein